MHRDDGPGSPARWRRLQPVLLGLLLFAVYLANRGEPIGADDTEAAMYLPLALIRGDGPYLDRFEPIVLKRGRHGALPFYATRSRGHLVSRYPLAPAIVAVPVVWPMVVALDLSRPGWDRDTVRLRWHCERMAKVSSALIAAAGGVVLFVLLVRLGLGRVALPAVVAATLGSDWWAVASQAPWQHGPVTFALTLAMLCLVPEHDRTRRARLLLAGVASAAIVAFRVSDVVLSAAIALAVAWRRPRDLAWFLPGPLLIGALLIGSNLWFFGKAAGGLAELDMMHPQLHHLPSAWSSDVVGGALGTLFSPSRGLFVFCPWTMLALVLLPATWGRIKSRPVLAALVVSLAPLLLMLSAYSVWWAGHCFGPRYWTDAIPILAVLLAYALDWAATHCRPVLALAGPAIALSVGIQALGAFCYPSSWNDRPGDVDTHHDRLWSWTDSELTRCLGESRLGRDQRRHRPRGSGSPEAD